MKISTSSERNTFQRDSYVKRRAEEGLTPENDKDVKAMVEYYDSLTIREEEREVDTEWQKDNLEYDLRSTDWILEKVRSNETYAQNLYAAMCNREFIRNDVWPILSEKKWSCSWRYAGGIVAHMQEKGDYIDWYCSGIRDSDSPDNGFVAESVVTDEIKADLLKLGWIVVEDDYES
jgi:hypothetical protein